MNAVVVSDIPCRLPSMGLCLADRQPLWTSHLVPNKDLPFYRARLSDPFNLVILARGIILVPGCPPVHQAPVVEIYPVYSCLRPGMPHNNQYGSVSLLTIRSAGALDRVMPGRHPLTEVPPTRQQVLTPPIVPVVSALVLAFSLVHPHQSTP